MGKNRKRSKAAQKRAPDKASEIRSEVSKFEIGVKGDEFDIKFSRAASEKTGGADALLRSLSKETRTAGFNLLGFAIPALLMLFLSVSFFALSRGEGMPKLTAASLADGSFTAELGRYYADTLPFKYYLESAGHALGFCDEPEAPQPEMPPEDEDITPEPDQTEPTLPQEPVTEPTTEPEITSAPESETLPSTVQTEPEPEIEPPETFSMYANAAAGVRLSPDTDSMIMGYFDRNERVPVIEIRDDGWASIWYNGMVAYVSSDLLSETKQRDETEATEPETEPEETEPEVTETEPPTEESIPEPTTEPTLETEPETTSRTTRLDPQLSAFLERSRIEEERRAAESQNGGEAVTTAPEY